MDSALDFPLITPSSIFTRRWPGIFLDDPLTPEHLLSLPLRLSFDHALAFTAERSTIDLTIMAHSPTPPSPCLDH